MKFLKSKAFIAVLFLGLGIGGTLLATTIMNKKGRENQVRATAEKNRHLPSLKHSKKGTSKANSNIAINKRLNQLQKLQNEAFKQFEEQKKKMEEAFKKGTSDLFDDDLFADMDDMSVEKQLKEFRKKFHKGMSQKYWDSTVGNTFDRIMGGNIRADVKESDNSVTVTINIKGINSKTAEVKVDDGYIKVKGTQTTVVENNDKNSKSYSKSTSSFSKTFAIPDNVEDDKYEIRKEKDKVIIIFEKDINPKNRGDNKKSGKGIGGIIL